MEGAEWTLGIRNLKCREILSVPLINGNNTIMILERDTAEHTPAPIRGFDLFCLLWFGFWNGGNGKVGEACTPFMEGTWFGSPNSN